MLSMFFHIPLMREIEFTGMKDSRKVRYLQQSYGEATLSFSEAGNKTLLNTNEIGLEKLAFYLKSGNILTEIPNKDLSEGLPFQTNLYDSSGFMYYAKKVSYNLSNANDEIVVKFKEKPASLKGLFAYSPAYKITLENFQTE